MPWWGFELQTIQFQHLKTQLLVPTLTALNVRISGISCYAGADALVARGVTESVSPALLYEARIIALVDLQVAVLMVGAIVVFLAFRTFRQDAVAVSIEPVTKFRRANAFASIVYDHSAFQCTLAVSIFVDLETFFYGAVDAFIVFV